MKSRREFSPQTLPALAAPCEQPSRWQHGSALEEPQPGRPRLRLYRLMAGGLASATGALAASAQRQLPGRPAAAGARDARQPGGHGVAVPVVR